MKATYETKQFRTAVNAVASAVPKQSDALKDALLDCTDGSYLSATSPAMSVRMALSGTISERGKVLLPVDRLKILLPSIRSETIEISDDDTGLNIASGSEQYHFDTASPDTFPERPSDEDAPHFWLSGSNLAKLISRTSGFCDVDSTKFAMGGSLLSSEGPQVSMCGFNGSMAVQSVPVTVDDDVSFLDALQPIVPFALMEVAKRLVTKDDEPVRISIGRSITFSSGDITLSGSLLEGRFPPYKKVIDLTSDWTESAMVDPKELLDAAKRVSATLSSDSRAIKMTLVPGGLELSNRKGKNARGSALIAADYDQDEVSLWLSHQTLEMAVDNLKSEEKIAICLTKCGKYGIITVEGYAARITSLTVHE